MMTAVRFRVQPSLPHPDLRRVGNHCIMRRPEHRPRRPKEPAEPPPKPAEPAEPPPKPTEKASDSGRVIAVCRDQENLRQ